MLILATLLILFLLSITFVASITSWEKSLLCAEVPPLVLENILGGAFNSRYMSVNEPFVQTDTTLGGKRDASFGEDFYVDANLRQVVDEEPAWNVVNHVNVYRKKYGLHRSKRAARARTRDYLQEWQCKSRIDWIDLGKDYFPRFLKTVVCETEKCWFGVYKCTPRSFSVKLLRRKKGYCTSSSSSHNVGYVGLPKDLQQLWIWEEVAVNFCCDCERA